MTALGIDSTGEQTFNEDTLNNVIDSWQQTVDLIARILSVPAAIVTRLDGPKLEVLQASKTEGNPYKAGMTVLMNGHFCQHVLRTGDTLHVRDASADPCWKNAPELGYGICSYLGMPIRWPDETLFGTICALDSKPNAYGEDYCALLASFRDQIESQLRLYWQHEALSAQLAEIDALRGLIPICAHCKQVRDDQGYWNDLDHYMRKHALAEFSHSVCPDCERAHYGTGPDTASLTG